MAGIDKKEHTEFVSSFGDCGSPKVVSVGSVGFRVGFQSCLVTAAGVVFC